MYVLTLVACLVEGCLARAQKLGRLREHFMYRHWKAKVPTLQGGPKPLQRCPSCEILMTAARLEKHKQTGRCDQATEIQLRQRDVELDQRSGEIKVSLFWRELDELVEGAT